MNYWLAQFNPDDIDVISYLRRYFAHFDNIPLDWWLMHKINMPGQDKEILGGDIVFIWRAKGKVKAAVSKRGIYGKAVVKDMPGKTREKYGDLIKHYIINQSIAHKCFKEPYFDVQYKKLVLDDPILEPELMHVLHRGKKGKVLDRYQWRTYMLDEEEGKAIETLVDKHRDTVL